MSFAAIWETSLPVVRNGLLNDPEDLVFLQDDVLLVVDLDLGAGILAEQDPIAGLHFHRDPLEVVVEAASTHGDDLPFHRLFPGGVGDDDTALGFLTSFHPLDQDPIEQRPTLPPGARCAAFEIGDATITLAAPSGETAPDGEGSLRARIAAHGEGPYALALRTRSTTTGLLDQGRTHGVPIELVAA